MNTRKSYEISLFIIIMIMLNFCGKVIANNFSLPLWLDSVGTVFAAYICDPFCGAVVGFAGNLMYGIKDPISIIYGITNITIALCVGYAVKKKWFDTVFGTLTASVMVTFFSVVISTPINYFTGNGMTGNIWGDGVICYLIENDVKPIVAYIVGEFYMDFLDKVTTMFLLYISIKFVHFKRRKMKVNLLLTVIILSLSVLSTNDVVKAASSTVYNNNIQVVYSSDNGLPCGEANDVIQTNDGILWVGTYAGLYRYNGTEFKWMSNYDTVRNVNCLFMDEEGRLWIGTNDNGLAIAINEKVNNVVDVSNGLPANSVRSITKSSDGNYYIGTTSSLQVMTLDGGLDMVADIPEVVYAHSMSADKNNNVAVVTNDGDLFIINGTKIMAKRRLDNEQEIYKCVTFSDSGMLYVGTSSNKIISYDVSGGKLSKKGVLKCGELNVINKIHFTDDGLMFICSDNGIGYLDLFKTFHYINTGNFNNSIDNMTVDYQGNLWFSSSRLGLLKLSHSPFADIYRLAGMKGKVVNSVTKWQNDLYVGTDNGLDVVELESDKQVENDLTKMLSDIRIRCLKVDSEDNLWICTYGKGLFCVTKDGEINTFDSNDNKFGDWVRVAIELSDGTIAASSDIGLGFFSKESVKKTITYNKGIGKDMILCIAELSDGRILCGTDGDGIAIVEDGEVTGRFNIDNGLSSNVVLRIVEDPVEKGAYIVTSNGLCYMDRYDNINLLENFPYYNNYDVWAGEDGELFVLSSAGIYVIHRDQIIHSNKKPEYELLNSKRGLKATLTANSWNYIDNNGYLYLSCDNGVYRMNINDFGVTRKSYRMMISSINLDGEPNELERGEQFVIGRDISKMEIIPEVINYTVEDPTVQYYLEGFDSSPTEVLQSELSTIVYTNLPSGEYKFHLAVLDNQNMKVIEESVYVFVKENEIYDTRIFHIYMLIVAMLTVAWFTWFIARTQIQRTINFQKKELEFAKNQLRMGNETILTIAKTVDAKDEYTNQHSERVSEYSVLIARELGFSEEECENLRKAALLHDIGKIGIPDRVLNKPGRLSDEEYALMKSHVTRGAEILKDFTLVDHVIDGTLFHHERFDGTGYPQGLSGEDIPLYGRIIGVADAFDAMTDNRVYRKKLDFDFVIEELKRCSGTQFDPKMVEIMLKLIDEGKIDVHALYEKKNDTIGDDSGSDNNSKESDDQ